MLLRLSVVQRALPVPHIPDVRTISQIQLVLWQLNTNNMEEEPKYGETSHKPRRCVKTLQMTMTIDTLRERPCSKCPEAHAP